MENLTAKINQESNLPDISKFNKDSYFYSETTMVYFDEDKFHYPVRIRFCRHKTRIFCTLWVIYKQYHIRGGSSCSVGESGVKYKVLQNALNHAGISISPSLWDSKLSVLGYRLEEGVAIAIAHALNLNPNRWAIVSSGGE